MKKGFKLALCGLGLFAIAGLGVGLSLKEEFKPVEPQIVLAEGEEPETLPCQVVIDPVKHGSITVSLTEGNVGDICVVTAKHDLLYRVNSVSVNGAALIESETVSGEFSFALVEGENKITASFVVDEELCGSLTNIIKQASEKDWTNLFTVENVIVLVKWVLDGGILIAVIRYYVKDKKLAKKLEETTKNTVQTIVPEVTKLIVVQTIKEVIQPMFADMKADNTEMMRCMNVFAKCMALGQENTPDSRRAILDELSGLKIGDLETIGEVKRYIEKSLSEQNARYDDILKRLDNIGKAQEEFIGEVKEAETVKEEPVAEPVKEPEPIVETPKKQATE